LPDGNQFDFTYDDEGNLLTASNNDSLLEFAYDELGRLTSERQVNNLIVGADSTVTRTYDGKGNRLTMTSDIGLTQYTYDDLDRLTSITAPDSSVIGFEYDDIGRRTEMSMPNGVVTTYAYDLASRYLSITHENVGGTFSSYGYTYDGNGNRTNVTVNRPGLPVNPTLDFSYDDIQQLVSATHIISGNPIETFLYDQLGNRIRRDGELEDAIYDANNAIEQNEGFLFVHDDNGNLVEQEDRNSGEVKRFEWDPEDRLTQITFHPSSVSPPNSTVLYAYDALDRRIFKDIDGTTGGYTYDGEDILFESDSGNTVTASFTHGPASDEPLLMERNAVTYCYQRDVLGSVISISDEGGNIAQNYTYDSFGIAKVFDAANMEVDPSLVIKNPYTYTSRESDLESGLYFMRARYFDPTGGRFISEDPNLLSQWRLR
jgi:RHS repeat-associated protein